MLFTQGEVVKGTWSRKDMDSRTIFKDKNGKQFRLSPGTTWIYVVDQNMNCDYVEGEPPATEESTEATESTDTE